MSNPSALHTFIRIDRSGKPIDSTNKSLKNAPKQGRWLKINNLTGNVCCDTITIQTNAISTSGTGAVVSIFCDGVTQEQIYVIGDYNSLAELVVLLNNQAPGLGVFSQESGFIYLKTPRSSHSCSGTLSMTIYPTTELQATIASYGSDWAVNILCDGTPVLSFLLPGLAGNMADLITKLNYELNWLGVFTGTGNTVTLNTNVSGSICSGVVTMTIVLN